jgi:uncharacterized caspase-like protein
VEFSPLQSPERDANEFARLLKEKYAFECTLLANATRAEVLGALDKLASVTAKDDLTLFYFSGHGIRAGVA